MSWLTILLLIYAGIQVLAIILYIPRITLMFGAFRKQEYLKNPNKTKIGVLIAAKNEGKTILTLLNSFKNQTYPKELYDVHLIVTGPNDTTIPYAKGVLDNLYIHDDILGQTRKGDALDGCLKKLFAQPEKFDYDEFIIVDADNMLTPNFLEEMNNSLMSGADVIIPRKRIKNWESSNKKNRTLVSNCSGLTWPGLDAMGNKAKCRKGYLMAMGGQGMLIKAHVLKKLGGYPFKSITEDFEIAIECMRKKYKQYYYEHAEIFSEEAVTHKEFNKRRMRWIKGFAQFNKKYSKEVKSLTFTKDGVVKENLMFTYGLLPVIIMFATSAVFLLAFLISALVLAFTCPSMVLTALLYALIVVATAYLELFLYGVLSINVDRDVNKMTAWEKIALAFTYPLFTFEYVGVFAVAFTSKDDGKWKEVQRIEM